MVDRIVTYMGASFPFSSDSIAWHSILIGPWTGESTKRRFNQEKAPAREEWEGNSHISYNPVDHLLIFTHFFWLWSTGLYSCLTTWVTHFSKLSNSSNRSFLPILLWLLQLLRWSLVTVCRLVTGHHQVEHTSSAQHRGLQLWVLGMQQQQPQLHPPAQHQPPESLQTRFQNPQQNKTCIGSW